MTEKIFEMRHIDKLFGDLLANDDVSIHLNRGEILCLVGENGAGKSTIMKILYGLVPPTAGEIYVQGQKVRFHTPSDAMARGIGMVQQHFMLFESMTVAENIVFKNEIRNGPFMDRKRMVETVRALSEKYGLKIDPEAKIEDCPVGLRQRVEILKILYQNAEIIIFDEPSAVLTPLEVESLLETIKSLAASGKSIVLITHKLQEVMAVADRIYVMRGGKVVAERLRGETNSDELAFLMVGHHPALRDVPEPKPGEVLLETRKLSLHHEGRDILKDVDMHVNAGEVVGIAGVSGNGQTELELCLTGLEKPTGGQVFLLGKDVTNAGVKSHRDGGMAYISEDRYLWGSAGEGTLSENVLMAKENRPDFNSHGFLNYGAIKDYTNKLIKRFDVKASDTEQKIRELSGGNAQKLITAREIMMETPVLICCEPTRGIDIGAMEFIHDQILEMREKGSGILLVSSELSEIMTLSDRIYVLFEGKIAGEFKRGSVDEKTLGILMLGGSRDEI
ncbi:MAG: ABC transporter ATP-binding protein [Anaerolineaceae bacterium]|nr:ABC transporter ATP-binding protein [Anaerolineaceae bacterium]